MIIYSDSMFVIHAKLVVKEAKQMGQGKRHIRKVIHLK